MKHNQLRSITVRAKWTLDLPKLTQADKYLSHPSFYCSGQGSRPLTHFWVKSGLRTLFAINTGKSLNPVQ